MGRKPCRKETCQPSQNRKGWDVRLLVSDDTVVSIVPMRSTSVYYVLYFFVPCPLLLSTMCSTSLYRVLYFCVLCVSTYFCTSYMFHLFYHVLYFCAQYTNCTKYTNISSMFTAPLKPLIPPCHSSAGRSPHHPRLRLRQRLQHVLWLQKL